VAAVRSCQSRYFCFVFLEHFCFIVDVQDPTSPLDVTDYIQPGSNVIRFIQLADMVHRTFILYASRAEPTNASDATQQAEEDFFNESPSLQTDNNLSKFGATVTVS